MNRKMRPTVRPPGRHPYSTWWLLVKDGNSLTEVLTVNDDGERMLPAFSGEGEAEMFLWLGVAFEGGWRVRETSAGELVSLLSGPRADVESIALDPSPGMVESGTIDLVSVDRKRFVGRVVALGGKNPAPRLGAGPRVPVIRDTRSSSPEPPAFVAIRRVDSQPEGAKGRRWDRATRGLELTGAEFTVANDGGSWG